MPSPPAPPPRKGYVNPAPQQKQITADDVRQAISDGAIDAAIVGEMLGIIK